MRREYRREQTIHTFNNFPVGIGFARLDAIAPYCEQFETVLPIAAICRISDRNIFKRDYTSRLLVGGVFEIIQAFIREYEPSVRSSTVIHLGWIFGGMALPN